jgi:hypothetical protein
MQNQKQESPTGKKIITMKLEKTEVISSVRQQRTTLLFTQAIYLRREQPVRFSTLGTA